MLETIIFTILALLIRSLVSAYLLRIGTRLTGHDADFIPLFLISLASSFLCFVPGFSGNLLSGVALCVLLSKVSTAEIWPHAALIVTIAWGISMILGFAVLALFV